MIDRSIGIIGLALALLTVTLQYQVKTMPPWAPLLGYSIGFLLLGISFGLLCAGGLRRRSTRDNALLRLHVYGDHRLPDRLAYKNIFRWFYLWTTFDGIQPDGTTQRIGSIETLFVSFDEDVKVSTLTVRSPDAALPLYEVKEFNQRYAIITFSSAVPPCTLEVAVID
ncbi:MAG: hypothetical protein ACN6OU_01815 [Stenotrophomonas acidaminiphila]